MCTNNTTLDFEIAYSISQRQIMSAGDTPIHLTQISTFLHAGPVNSVEHSCVQILQINI